MTTLYGEDAQRLLDDLENGCSVEEADRRSEAARIYLARMERPKPLENPYIEHLLMGPEYELYFTATDRVCLYRDGRWVELSVVECGALAEQLLRINECYKGGYP